MKLPDKQRVRDAVVERLTLTLQHMAKTAEATRRDATHEEARPENDKDTRALEQSYLARGQAIRAESMIEQLKLLRSMPLPRLTERDVICAGALIELEDDSGSARCVFLAPHGGGETVHIDGLPVLVVTPVSALGRAILGKRVGDEFELRVKGTTREYTIAAVC